MAKNWVLLLNYDMGLGMRLTPPKLILCLLSVDSLLAEVRERPETYSLEYHLWPKINDKLFS